MSEATNCEAEVKPANIWLNRQPFVVSAQTHDGFKRVKKWFGRKLCGKKFEVGSNARWIYANGTPGMGTGNFFVCSECDGDDKTVMEKGKASLDLAIKLSEQWGLVERCS